MSRTCDARLVSVILSSLLSIPSIVAAGEKADDTGVFAWTKSVGFSYPLVASLSGGIHAPSRFDAFGFQGNVDLGIGGGMVSGGVYVPVGGHKPYTLTAFTVKVAVLRTWLVDLGPDMNRTYTGAVIEQFSAGGGMGAKIGLGYFRSNEPALSSTDGFLYFYVGLGL